MRVPSDDVIRPGNHFTINSVAPNEDVVSDRERSGVQRWHIVVMYGWLQKRERSSYLSSDHQLSRNTPRGAVPDAAVIAK